MDLVAGMKQIVGRIPLEIGPKIVIEGLTLALWPDTPRYWKTCSSVAHAIHPLLESPYVTTTLR